MRDTACAVRKKHCTPNYSAVDSTFVHFNTARCLRCLDGKTVRFNVFALSENILTSTQITS